MSTITVDQLRKAAEEENAHLPISDPAVRLLRSHIHAISGRVQGSDQSRYRVRSQIWSTAVVLGPPTLWMTINPADIHDPIAQVFAGENIDLDNFIALAGPDKHKRAKNIADDPYAAAKFFHFMISIIVESLLGVKVTKYQVKSMMGVLGEVAAYIGLDEVQARGMIHWHVLIILRHAPSGDEILEFLRSEEFREKVKTYIAANIHAYAPGLESAESVKAIPRDSEVAYNRPPHPDSRDYKAELSSFEQRVARAEQVHTCRLKRCLIPDRKTGHVQCKRRAPFKCAEEAFVEENGEWGAKRLYEYMNGWNPSILINARCNNDLKLLTNGGDTRNITFYVTSYATKNQAKTHTLSALMAKGYVYHLEHPNAAYLNDLRDNQRLLLFRLSQTITREQELAGPLVMSYLMGWGDVQQSHTYSPIYWSSFLGALLRNFPELRRDRTSNIEDGERYSMHVTQTPPETDDPVPESEEGEAVLDDDQRTVTLDISSDRKIIAKSQLTDYVYRNLDLSGSNVLDFFVDTYDRIIRHPDDDIDQGTRTVAPGRRKHARYRYLSEHPKAMTTLRIKRAEGHRNLPNFLGPWFPRRDDTDVHELYCASMLTLLKPWRDIKTDLKGPFSTWQEAFEAFLLTADTRTKFIISNIQYFHECERSAKESRETQDSWSSNLHVSTGEGDLNMYDLGEDVELNSGLYSEEGLRELLNKQGNYRELLHGRLAVEIAKHCKIFEENTEWMVSADSGRIGVATGNDLQKLAKWQLDMEHYLQEQEAQNITPHPNSSTAHIAIEPDVTPLHPLNNAILSLSTVSDSTTSENGHSGVVDVRELRPDQHRAYEIVIKHLEQTLNGDRPEPMRMILYGEGGAGKSRVIQKITEAFVAQNAKLLLIKSAYTGVAASLIDGKTTHTLGHFGRSMHANPNDKVKAELQKFWKERWYIIIDEYSMLSKTFFALLARNIGIGVEGSGHQIVGYSFGGANVILGGDLHQFPPVAVSANDILYYPADSQRDNSYQNSGRTIYEEFTTVVILKEQMRVTDPIWRDFLRRLRHGKVTSEDAQMLRGLILRKGGSTVPDFSTHPWDKAVLVTPRHAVRAEWNKAAINKWCADSGEQLFICSARDRIGSRALTLREKYAVAARQSSSKGKKNLPHTLALARGMKVLITDNIETDLDITNGARGEIVDIILHPDEPDVQLKPIVELIHLPVYVLVRLERTRAAQLEGLDPGVVPVVPEMTRMTINIDVQGKQITRTVHRSQFPIAAAYAFTDYRAQGQTIPNLIVDIATPPSGKLSLVNLYVALSRGRGREAIRLLRDFDDKILMQGIDAELEEEDRRLETLHESTKAQWEEQYLGESFVNEG